MGEQVFLRAELGPTEADELEKAIYSAFSRAGEPLSDGTFHYNGPPSGAFGLGGGFLGLLGDAWSNLMKVPEAVKILAQGIADYLRLRGDTQTVVFEIVDDQISVSFNSTGNAAVNDPAEIARSLATVLKSVKGGG
ncbi:MAG: hypothetical protein QGH60_04555 [Phycisphaerae bacterium]|jgi:hypothetical protein|nr:hypothetical protein [Phycisphaerae bacterium]